VTSLSRSALAKHTALIAAPSPLEGEGYWVFQRKGMGEGVSSSRESCIETPSPIHALLEDHLALSLKGRGHNNARPESGEVAP
jgi:hypothetical protein